MIKIQTIEGGQKDVLPKEYQHKKVHAYQIKYQSLFRLLLLSCNCTLSLVHQIYISQNCDPINKS